MTHPLVQQLRFTRSEWRRGLEGVTLEEAARRFEPMNAISWMVGHLAAHEQLTWLERGQSKVLNSAVQQCGYGQPPTTPPFDAMWSAWHAITQEADSYLDGLTSEGLRQHFIINGKPHPETIGTTLQRVIYHYWYHLGEALAIRQLLGHTGLPQFVGDLGGQAPYRSE